MARSSKSPSKTKSAKNNSQPVDAVEQPAVEVNHQPHKPKRETTTMSDMPSIIEYDTDLAEAEAPVPLPVGDYPATIRSAEVKKSAKGNDYVNVTFYISPEDYPADYTEGDEDGVVLGYGRLSPENTQRARWGMRKFQEAIGAKLSKQIDLNDWVGLTAIVSISHDNYEGEKRAQIKQVKQA